MSEWWDVLSERGFGERNGKFNYELRITKYEVRRSGGHEGIDILDFVGIPQGFHFCRTC
jgi:hypothetical protein